MRQREQTRTDQKRPEISKYTDASLNDTGSKSDRLLREYGTQVTTTRSSIGLVD